MLKTTSILSAMVMSVALSSAALAAEPAMMSKTASGEVILTDADGKTLYVYDKDSAGKSACVGTCATNWPPLLAESGATPSGPFTVVERDDGTLQWAYGSKPLYTWSKDMKAGEMKGEGMANGAWHVAKPQ